MNPCPACKGESIWLQPLRASRLREMGLQDAWGTLYAMECVECGALGAIAASADRAKALWNLAAGTPDTATAGKEVGAL